MMIKLLIVDDSIFSQKIIAHLIQNFLPKVEIYFADNGKDGFIKYKEIKPNYVFVDLLMPNLNGKELIKLIKEYDYNAKIIVISADVQKSVKEEIEKYKIMLFINKPFNEEKAKQICDMIRNDSNE
jgi:two-component system chemotaxis response regulator CheY